LTGSVAGKSAAREVPATEPLKMIAQQSRAGLRFAFLNKETNNVGNPRRANLRARTARGNLLAPSRYPLIIVLPPVFPRSQTRTEGQGSLGQE
jgi:hypothetical protein